MRRLRLGANGSGERDALLDVRRHVRVEAHRVDPVTGAQLGIFNTLGGASGGESQELVAFIVGAALRFQLGHETQGRPVYAPVMLDEGFVKADSEFAGRAVRAWLGLGFQLIVGAPLDKVMGMTADMGRTLMVTKSTAGLSQVHVVEPVPVPTDDHP